MNNIGAATSFPNTYTRTTQLTGENKQPELQPPVDKHINGGSMTNTDGTAVSTQPPTSLQIPEDERQQIVELTARDAEVRAHEAAHKAAGGSLTGPASFTYQTGPNGKRYAIGGEVSVDTSPVPGDPQATLLKANRIRAAATAPAQPSTQDNSVAASASAMASEARAQILSEQRLEQRQEHQNTAEINERSEENTNAAASNPNTTAEQDTDTTSRLPSKQARQAYSALATNTVKTTRGRHIDLMV